MQHGRHASAQTYSNVRISQKAVFPLRSEMTDRFRIYLPVWFAALNVADLWSAKSADKTPYDVLICQYTECSTVGIRIDELEEALLEWLKDYIVKYEFTDTHEEDAAAIAAKEMIVTNLKQSIRLF